MNPSALTVDHIRNWKEARPLLAVTAYDYTIARHLDEAGVDILHVGDSLGMVVLGLEDTTGVTMEDMLRATTAVARARKRACITADLPFGSYPDASQAVAHSRALFQAGADAVKMEGGASILEQIRAVLAEGIPVQAHLGMLPQRIREEGAYRKKGKTEGEAEKIISDAKLLEKEGVFSIVLEAVTDEVARHVTAGVDIPTIGIASGMATTGQIRVVTDIIGTTPWYQFPHVEIEADGAKLIRDSILSLKRRLKG